MTREEIEELKGLAASMGFYDDKNPCKRAVILGKAIQELAQQPCDDEGIAVKSIATAFQVGVAFGFGKKYDEMDKVIEDIKKVITPQPKIGHWILIDKEKNKWRCTHCIELDKDDWWKLNEGTPQDNHMDFCPHCGAKMQEVEE